MSTARRHIMQACRNRSVQPGRVTCGNAGVLEADLAAAKTKLMAIRTMSKKSMKTLGG